MAVAAVMCFHTGMAQEHTPLSMADAVRIALENHPAAHSATGALSASRGRFWRSIAPPPPSVSLDYSYVPFGKPLKEFGEKTWEINQSLEFPLVTIARGTGLSREVNARENELDAARREVAASAKVAYVRTLASEQRLSIAKENLAIADSFLHDAKVRKNVGEGTQLELLTAQVQRTQAANAVETARTTLLTARSELRSALGLTLEEPSFDVTLSDSLAYRPLELALDSLQSAAQRTSPLLAASEYRVGAAEAERTAAWMAVLPSLNFSYYRQTVGNNPNLYGMKFGLSLPIWFLLDTRGQVQEAAAGVAVATASLRSARSAVSLEVTSAFNDFANNKRQVELQRLEILPQAEEIYRVASISYVAGEVSYVEFLQASQALNEARNTLLDTLLDYNIAIFRLERILGNAL
jgi:outer membrane protein TolC